jgi:hypothetical protein
MPSIPTRAELKAYFETGDHPTQAQFAALIDAIYDLVQGATDVADAAAADAAAAVAYTEERAPRAYAHFKYTTTGTDRWTVDSAVGCTIVLSGAYSHTATITFDTAIGDDKYTILWNGDEHGGAAPTLVSKASDVLVIQLPGAPPSNGDTSDFVVIR